MGPAGGDAAPVPSTLLCLYQAEINKEMLVSPFAYYVFILYSNLGRQCFYPHFTDPLDTEAGNVRGLAQGLTASRDRAGSTSGLWDWQRLPCLLPCRGQTVC